MMRRREFTTLVGSAAVAWPLTAHAQRPTMPVIGFLHPTSSDTNADRLRAFRQGLKDTGYVDGDNVKIEYRWAEGQFDLLPAMAAELVRRRVAVIVTAQGPAPALAAQAATKTIPIVFNVGEDPVKLGLVASIARPGGNLTGVNFLATESAAKRVGLLRELVPKATHVAVLVNPTNPSNAQSQMREVDAAARTIGWQVQVFNASTAREINGAFAALVHARPDALFVLGDALFTDRRVQLALLAAHYSVPALYSSREITEVGGLMSYGTNIADGWRQVGVYTSRILKGEKPADLPVMQATKFELVINAETARLLNFTIPPTLLTLADEVIE